MRSTYSSRQSRRHLYYVCRNKKADTKCQQQPVAAVDLETSLMEQLKRSFGCDFDMAFLPNSLERVSYDSRTREVGVTLADASQFAYTLPVAKRPGVRRTFENQAALGRVPRVSRLMALVLPVQRAPPARRGAKSCGTSTTRLRQPSARVPDSDAREPGTQHSRHIALSSQNHARPRSHNRTQPSRYREARRLGRADPAVSFPLGGFATVSRCPHIFKRYTRSPSRSNERTFRLCFDRLREMKPRTVWACHPV